MGFKWLQPAKVQVVKIFDDVYGVLLAKTVDLFFNQKLVVFKFVPKTGLDTDKNEDEQGFQLWTLWFYTSVCLYGDLMEFEHIFSSRNWDLWASPTDMQMTAPPGEQEKKKARGSAAQICWKEGSVNLEKPKEMESNNSWIFIVSIITGNHMETMNHMENNW